MARKALLLNEMVREKVRHLAGVGVRQAEIAKIIGCAPKTLRKWCREDLDRGVAEANAMVSGYLFANAKAGNVAAQALDRLLRAVPQLCSRCRLPNGLLLAISQTVV